MWRTSRPHYAVVGQVPGTEHFRNVLRHEVLTSAHVLSLRIDGSLYFASDREDGKHLHLYRAQRRGDGTFSGPAKIGPPIADEELGTGDTYVAPDESYMILSSRRPPGFGNGDLFVAFRQMDGRWGPPVNLGPAINTTEHEFCPMATPDGKYLFFSRRWGATWETTTAGDVYWIDARVLDEFRRPR